jgi:prepilin-type N-terminal cleavage/methylation domain-containing protein
MKGPVKDEGMTLVELVVAVVLLGVVTVVIAATFSTILRVTPATAYRIDDARSTRGLQTWLARDVASTPPIPYDPSSGVGYVDSIVTPSVAGVPAGDICTTSGVHVLFMAWSDGGTSYRAQYTIEGDAGGYEVRRTICGGNASALSVTGDVSNSECASARLSELVLTDIDSDGLTEARVELCFVSAQSAGGLIGGDDRQEITMSVASRNGDT